VGVNGKIECAPPMMRDELLYTQYSPFTLTDMLSHMFSYSNNFVANQILIAAGAHRDGAPGTLEKGVKVVEDCVRDVLRLDGLAIVEGSGISRKNRLSPRHMSVILRHFAPYRHLLPPQGNTLFKTGTLRGIRTRAGYIEIPGEDPSIFIIFLHHRVSKMESIMRCLIKTLEAPPDNPFRSASDSEAPPAR
jgi:D-alanyl-D-alanine carboxypeptidase/D-alanyl-D-alanine-endopeptidase (penicillin-binding protein 4)